MTYKEYQTYRAKIDIRVKKLMELHQKIINLGDEEAYEWWIAEGIPDEPDSEDFEWIAKQEDEYSFILELFNDIVKEYGEEK